MAFDLASAQPVPQSGGFDLTSAQPVASAPKEGDTWPEGKAPPKGFYAVTEDGGHKSLRKEWGPEEIVKALSDLPGVGMAERLGQGVTRLGGKVASGYAGMAGGPEAAQKVRSAVNDATELPPSNDPLVQGVDLAQQGIQKGVDWTGVEKAQGDLSPALRTGLEATEEAIPDITGVLGVRGALPERVATTNIARSPAEVAEAAGYTGLRTRADLLSPGAQTVTDTLISKDAGIVPGQTPSVAALENARKVGPGRIYHATEDALPHHLTQDPELQTALGNLPQQVSQLPRSPDVEALQETMLAKPNFTKDELFANIREARERAKSHWKSDDPDKGALGDAYHSLANAYEDFAGRQPGVDLPLWLQARVQMAKNYQAQAALQGAQGSEHFNARVYGQLAERNPHLLTGNAAIVGHVASGLPAAAATGTEGLMAAGLGAGAGEAAGHFAGVPVVGGIAGAVAGPMLRAKLADLLRRGRPDLAAQTSTNPELSYFFNHGKMPEGWNRSPVTPQIAGLLPSPSMVNAGGGASTPSTLENLGLTPDVQSAGAQHPAAARLAQLREQISRPPMPEVDFQGPQKWGDFSIAPPGAPTPQAGGIPFENVLEQGGTQRPPVGAPAVTYRPPSKSPKGAQMRTPPGAPTLTDAVPQGPSPAQLAERSRQAAARLRKVAGDLRVDGPGNATGSPVDRLREALLRRERGYADGGGVPRGSSSPGSPGVSGAIHDALAALRNYLFTSSARDTQETRRKYEDSIAEGTNSAAHPAASAGYAGGGRVELAQKLEEFLERLTQQRAAQDTAIAARFPDRPRPPLVQAPDPAQVPVTPPLTPLQPPTVPASDPALGGLTRPQAHADGGLVGRGAPQLPAAEGLREPGTIKDIWDRPVLQNPDGSISTTLSMSIGTDKGETLIPQVVNGQKLTPQQAIEHYHKTGEHLGVFDTPEHADAYAQALHNAQWDYIQHQKPPVDDTQSSIRRLADAARQMGVSSEAEPRARVATNLASLAYGLDAQGNPALGGRAWTPSQGGTPAGALDAVAATPHNLIALINKLNGPGPQGTSSPHLQWSDDAATRLSQLKQRLQKAAGVAPAQSLGETATDAVTDPALIAPMGLAKVAGEGSALGKYLNWGAGGTEDSTHAAQGAH